MGDIINAHKYSKHTPGHKVEQWRQDGETGCSVIEALELGIEFLALRTRYLLLLACNDGEAVSLDFGNDFVGLIEAW